MAVGHRGVAAAPAATVARSRSAVRTRSFKLVRQGSDARRRRIPAVAGIKVQLLPRASECPSPGPSSETVTAEVPGTTLPLRAAGLRLSTA